MSTNRILGIIFANKFESGCPELTSSRTMGSVPFGGKYRLIDFPLSNMSNSGINNVGIITKSNFLSLMDHLGSGSAWDLARRRGGLTVLPPYKEHSFDSVVETLYNLHGFIEHGEQDYVLLAQAGCVTNINYSKVLEFHEQNDADITYIYSDKIECDGDMDNAIALNFDDDNRVTKVKLAEFDKESSHITPGTMLIRKDILMRVIREMVAENKTDFIKDFVQPNISTLKVYAYENKSYCALITSMKGYYKASMELMNKDIRAQLFDPKRPIYTKVRDDIPSKYGLDSSVKGSLIAQGCVIEGTVENSIISKGVYIGKNTVVKNCIIMQDSIIGDNANLSHIIVDKDVTVSADKTIMGTDSYPMYVAKRTVI